MASFLNFPNLVTSEKADIIQWISSGRYLRNCFLRQAGGWWRCHHHGESSCAPKALRRQLQYVILKQGPLSLTARQDTSFACTSDLCTSKLFAKVDTGDIFTMPFPCPRKIIFRHRTGCSKSSARCIFLLTFVKIKRGMRRLVVSGSFLGIY